MNSIYQLLPFSEIKHKLPADCWAYECNQKNDGEFENEQVLYFDGDTQLEHLNLDDVLSLQEKDESEYIFMVVVEGSLTIDSHIYNEDTDGATGLVVLGNLKAKNVIVGGQEIYVTGNLEVSELFWGDYNHGSLKVSGSIAAQAFISTDYSFDANRFRQKDRVQGSYWLWDEQDIMDNVVLSELLEEECLILDNDDPIICRETILEYFETGRPVLKIVEVESVPFVFENRVFNDANLQRLWQSPLFMYALPADAADGIKTIEYWRADGFKRVAVTKNKPYAGRIYFQQQDKAILIGYAPVKNNDSSNEAGYQPGLAVRTVFANVKEDAQSGWENYNPDLASHQVFKQMAESFWNQLLDEWSEIEYWQNKFVQTITTEKIEQLLALPMVKEQYSNSDDEDDDTEGLWEGLYHWQFTQGNEEEGDDPRVSIFRQLTTGRDDEENFEIYHFDIETLSNNEPGIVLYTQDGDGEAYKINIVPIDNVEAYRNAIRYFEMMYRRMSRLNEAYFEEKKDAIDAMDDIGTDTRSIVKEMMSMSSEEWLAKQDAAIDGLPDSNEPFLWQGHTFTRISARQARELLQAIPYEDYNLWDGQWVKPDPGYPWLLAEGDVTIDSLWLFGVVNEHLSIGGIIIGGNLTVKHYIDGSGGTACPPLCVLGDVTTTAACFSEIGHFILGNLHADILIGEYNDGFLAVKGDLYSKTIYTNEYPMHVSGRLYANLVLGDTLFVKYVKIEPAILSLENVFVPDVIEASNTLAYETLFQHVQEGENVLL